MHVDVEDGFGETWSIPVCFMASLHDPFSAWTEDPILMSEVHDAIAEGRLDPRPYDTVSMLVSSPDFRRYHVERIAWLVVHRDDTPICIDVGAPSLGYPPAHGDFDFIDGNHRLCAAVCRNDDDILVAYGGECDAMAELFACCGYVVAH